MRLSDLDPVALSQALDDHDPDREHWLDVEAGSLWTFVFSESTDETRSRREELRAQEGGRWVCVPSLTTQQAYEEVEDFIDGETDEEVREALFAELEKKGALRNFREVLVRMSDVRQRWTSFRRDRSRARREAFLAGLGIEAPPAVEPAEEGV